MASKRSYTQQTIKLLFGASGNQCAQPECSNPVIIEGTDHSDAMISAQICHIFAASDNGPRGKPGLTNEERNSAKNLLLLCPTHHGIVDGQYQTYPATMLQDWKSQHEAKFKKQIFDGNISLPVHFMAARHLVDAAIQEETWKLRKARFFGEFDQLNAARRLATKLTAGEYFGGSNEIKGRALAWCARLLAVVDDGTEASKILENAEQLFSSEELQIAKAFHVAFSVNVQQALSALAKLSTPASRTAALQISVNKLGAKEGIKVHKYRLKLWRLRFRWQGSFFAAMH
jgi:hypothetical protein